MAELGGSKLTNIIKAKEDMSKSPEQLKVEKEEIIKSRLVRLQLYEDKQKLIHQAKSFQELLGDLYDLIYDLNEKHDRQKYDMMELTKRAIQLEKGKSKTRKSNVVHTGLGGSIFPWLGDVSANAPGKISLFSRYERVTDRRSFANRREIWEHNPDEEKRLRDEEYERERAAQRPKSNVSTNARRQAFEKKEEEAKPIQRVRRKSVHSEPEEEPLKSESEPEHEAEHEAEPETREIEPEVEPESHYESHDESDQVQDSYQEQEADQVELVQEQEEQEEHHIPEPEDEDESEHVEKLNHDDEIRHSEEE